MIIRRIALLALCLQLVCSVLTATPACAKEQEPVQPVIEKTFNEAMELVARNDFSGARSKALELVNSSAWRAGDVRVAGAIRAIADELRSHKEAAMATEIINAARKAHTPTGDAARALEGRRVSAHTSRTTLRGFSRPGLHHRGLFNPFVDLKRIRAGNQSSVLKVMDASNTQVAYQKGLDGVEWAPIYDEHRAAIFSALGISPAALDSVANRLVDEYGRIQQKKEDIALLSVIGSAPGEAVSDATRVKILSFLVWHMEHEKNVVLRRQSMLALALQDATTPTTVDAVINFYGHSNNLWECFPVTQFFEYQAARIKKMANFATIRSRVAAIDGLYTPGILEHLQ